MHNLYHKFSEIFWNFNKYRCKLNEESDKKLNSNFNSRFLLF